MKRKIFIPLLLLGGLVLTSCGNADSGASITEVKLNKTFLKLSVGETFTLVASMVGGEKTPAFFSSDSSIASVNAEGVVTGVAEGEATIYVTANDKMASCNVKVAKHFYDPMTSIKEGTFKVNLDIGSDTNYSLAAPLRYEYQSLGGALDTDDTKMNFDIGFTKGIESEGKTATEQALDNIDFISYLVNSGFLGDDSLPYRSLGYNYKKINDALAALATDEEKASYLEDINEHISMGTFNDRNVFNAYTEKNSGDKVRYSSEETTEEDSPIKQIMALIDFIQDMKIDTKTIVTYDFVSILRNIFDGETVIIDDEGSSNIGNALRILGAAIFLFSSASNLSYKPVTIDGLKGANLHFYMSQSAQDFMSVIKEFAGDYAKYLDYVELKDYYFDLVLLQDKSVDSYNHIYSVKTNVQAELLGSPVNLTVDATLGTDRIEKDASYFSDINLRQNRFKNTINEVNRYINKIGDVISYSDSDDRRGSVSLLDSRYNEMLEGLEQFGALSENAQFVICTEKFNEDNIKELYDTGRSLLVTASNNLVSLTNNSKMEDVYNAIEPVYIYLDYKQALNEKSEAGFTNGVNITRTYLEGIKSAIATGVNSVKNLSADSSLDEVKSALLGLSDLYSSSGTLSDLLPNTILSLIPVEAKYNEKVMLTDELNEFREQVISSNEEYDEDEKLVNNLYALNKYMKEAFGLYLDKLVATYSGTALYDQLNIGTILLRSDFGKIYDIARTTLSDTAGYVSTVNVASLLSENALNKINEALTAKYNEVKETTLSEFAKLKTDKSLINIASWTVKEAATLIALNNIDDIQNALLDVGRRIDTSFVNKLLDEGNALIL